MKKRDIIARLKQADYKYAEARRIKEELRKKPLSEQREIAGELVNEGQKSDNSDIIDVINDIVNDLNPKK